MTLYCLHIVKDLNGRLREDGYVPPDPSLISSPSQSEVSIVPVIETISLKELSEKTATDYLKVIYVPVV